jgi:hypothetical protein
VTVLLEKELGNIYIGKLRAICLLEGDFNWFLKLTFSKRMMSHMQANEMIPAEQIATKGRVAIDGVLQKQFFYDSANTLHVEACLTSTDAANCYDAVNHPICSLAIQAMGVPRKEAVTYLQSIQRMTYYLRTGFGLASTGYGGTASSPFMGPAQGSCASPPIWTAISTLILMAYHRDGHGVTMTTAWTALVKKIGAILYVDDTDLLHMNNTGDDTISFIDQVQSALTSWSRLLQATGGNLKPEKCYYYIMSYRYDGGVARICTGRELRQYRNLTIPQHGGTVIDIALKDPKEATQTLGMFTSPMSDGYAHLAKMLSRCRHWEESIRSSMLPYRDRWHSLHTQLFPSSRYGLIPLMTPPAVLEEAFMDTYYRLLPLLNVNRNITSDWCWLPQSFQGLGLPNMGLEKLSQMLQYVVRHWGSGGPMDFQLWQSFELLQFECGLYGNPLTRDFRLYGRLATNTWIRLL